MSKQLSIHTLDGAVEKGALGYKFSASVVLKTLLVHLRLVPTEQISLPHSHRCQLLQWNFKGVFALSDVRRSGSVSDNLKLEHSSHL